MPEDRRCPCDQREKRKKWLDIAAAVVRENPVKPDRQASPWAEQHAARLHFEGEEIEFVLMLFQSVHFELETGVGVEEAPGLVLVFFWFGGQMISRQTVP
jgi:hypothetical protein